MSLLPEAIAQRLAAAMALLNPAVHAEIAKTLSRIYAPRCPLNCWQWCERNIILRPEESRDFHGPYDSALTPYVRRVMEFVTHPTDREFIVRKSSQLGFTLAYLLIVCYLAATRPTHALIALDSVTEVKKISSRLRRLFETNAALTDSFLGDGPGDDLQNLLFKLRGMDVFFSGSGTRGAFANKSLGLLILDELDLYLKRGGDSDAYDRARERGKEVSNFKLIAGGKPEGWNEKTNKLYLSGTRERLFLPCPHCGHFQPLEFERLRFEHCRDTAGDWDLPRVIDDTWYACENELCRPGRIDELHKPAMLRAYECRATNVGKDEFKPFPGRVSFHIDDLHIIRSAQNSWGHMAADFIDSRNSPTARIVFFNGRLARPEPEKATEINRTALHKLIGKYPHGCMPVRPAIHPRTGDAAIFTVADNQGSGAKKWVKVGFTPSDHMFVIDYGSTVALDDLRTEADNPVWIGGETPPSADDLRDAIAASVAAGLPLADAYARAAPGRQWFTSFGGFVDEGYDTFVVREWCHGTADPVTGIPRFFPCKGVATRNSRSLVEEHRDKFRIGRSDESPFVTVYHFADDAMKRELYIGRIAGIDGMRKNKKPRPRFHLPARTEDWFMKELMARHVEKVVKGRPTMLWDEPAPNDYGDACKMALALWEMLKADFLPPPVPA